jgi:hypothetical protein
VHVSAISHTPVLALHIVDVELKVSVGHVVELPVHFSAMSHTPVLALQTVDEALKLLGHTDELPVQYASLEHTPPALHIVDEELKISVGQVAEFPVHVSTASHVPTEALQTVEEILNFFVEVSQQSPEEHSSFETQTLLTQVEPEAQYVPVPQEFPQLSV